MNVAAGHLHLVREFYYMSKCKNTLEIVQRPSLVVVLCDVVVERRELCGVKQNVDYFLY